MKERGIDLGCMLLGEKGKELAIHSSMKIVPSSPLVKPHFDEAVFEEVRLAVMTQGHAVVKKPIQNTDRSIGTRLSGEIMFLHGPGGFKGNVQYRVYGAAGQSFGAFLADGVELRLRGIANDYVGKGMGGGLITVRSPKLVRSKRGRHSIIGNVALYGATGGRLLVAGRAGERFAVRNSGAAAVVEGVGNHGCEYMTRGTVVILGEIGRNFGAGMTGGVAYIYYSSKQNLENLSKDYVKYSTPTSSDDNLLWRMVRSHKFHTGSPLAKELLKEWETAKKRFVKITPKALDVIDFNRIYSQQVSMRMGELLNE
jgi:glutamate synthase domain-containing protein 3